MESSVVLATALQQLVESSDSSSDDDDDFMDDVLLRATKYVLQKEWACFKFDYEDVTMSYTEKEFLMEFRVQKKLFFDLVERFESSSCHRVPPKQGGGREPVSTGKKLLIFLWFVGHNTPSFRDVTSRFEVALSTLGNIITSVSDFLSGMAAETMKWPSDTENVACEDYYLQRDSFPRVAGCIGRTHIQVDKPQQDPDSYLNTRGFHSIQFQGICNHERKFIDTYIGYPGSADNAIVFTSSAIYSSLPQMCAGRFLLGDSTYPLSTFCLTPFKDSGRLTASQKKYNTLHSSVRSSIDNAFASLKQRFPQLYHVRLKSIYRVCQVVRACCALHNLSNESDLEQLEKYGHEPEATEGAKSESHHCDGDGVAEKSAKRVRMEIASQL